MASGTFVNYDKKQPGVYFNRKVMNKQNTNQSLNGIIAYPMNLDWGERGKIIEINSLQDCYTKLGYYYTDPKMRPIVEMFRGSNRTQGANKIYVIIPVVEGQAKAYQSMSAGDLEIWAKDYGERGNHITIVITPDLDTPYDDGGSSPAYAVKTVQILIDGVVMFSQTCGSYIDATHYTPAKFKDLKANDYVDWVYSGAGDENLLDSSGLTLQGGYSPEPTDAEFSSVLDVLDGKFFNVLVYDGTSNTLKRTFENFIQRQWDDKGYYCQLVTSNFYTDFEGVISIVNGMKLSDGTMLELTDATWWYAGITAGAKYNESLTHVQHPLAIDVIGEYNKDELNSFIEDGQVVFVKEYETVLVMKDLNTFHSYTPEKGKDLSSNRLLRVMNEICNYCNYQYNINYIGNLPNNEDGRDILKGNIIGKLLDMQANNGIKNFSKNDVQVNPIEEDFEAVEMIIGIQGVGAIEKIYVRLTVN